MFSLDTAIRKPIRELAALLGVVRQHGLLDATQAIRSEPVNFSPAAVDSAIMAAIATRVTGHGTNRGWVVYSAADA